ncbi:hypothetical protein EMGBS7_06040 [Candidatus Planktophila sp.]|nr:hypothetical protein EMGBS7_06040 [Candidatus Planktophila sp.]
MIALDALTFFLAAFAYLRVPNVKPTLSANEKFDWSILRDFRYIKAMLLSGVMSMHFILQNIAIPVWIVKDTNAPRWWVSVIMFINTIAVVLFQVRMSKGASTAQFGAKQLGKLDFILQLLVFYMVSAKGLDTATAAAVLIWRWLCMLLGSYLLQLVVGALRSN